MPPSQQGLLPLEPQPLGPAKPELASLTASYIHWLEQGSSKTREVTKLLGLRSTQNHLENLLTIGVWPPAPSS